MNIGTKWHTDLLDEIFRTFYLPKANNEGFAICSLFIYSKNTNSGDETIYHYWKEKTQFSFALPGSETITPKDDRFATIKRNLIEDNNMTRVYVAIPDHETIACIPGINDNIERRKVKRKMATTIAPAIAEATEQAIKEEIQSEISDKIRQLFTNEAIQTEIEKLFKLITKEILA